MPRKTTSGVLTVLFFTLLSTLSTGCSTAGENVADNNKVVEIAGSCIETPPAGLYAPAPDIPFKHVDGTTTTLVDYAGKSVLMLNFWGLRCQNCVEEMPLLEKLHNQYGRRGLVILGINTDGIPGDLLKKFLPQLPQKVDYPLVVDPDYALSDGYKMKVAPLTVILGKDGAVRYRHEGYDPSTGSEYIEVIERLLSE